MARFGSLMMAAALTAACSSSGSDAPRMAAELAFDASTTAREGATVQAFGEALDGAITEQEAQLKAVLERLTGLEADRDALSARVATLETENDALTKRLEVIEAKEPPIVDVLGTEVTGAMLPASSLLATLERLHTDLAALSSVPATQEEISNRVKGIEADVEALSDCPLGTTAVGEFCIDSAPRPSDLWSNAVWYCGLSGGHMCDSSEYVNACQQPGTLMGGNGEPQFTAELVMGPGGYAGASILYTGGLCAFAGNPVDDNLSIYPYRCCYHRVAPDAGPPLTPPG